MQDKIMTVAQASPARSIRYVKGIGPHRADQLARVGIQAVEDACYYCPLRYEDRTRFSRIGEAAPGVTTTVRGRVVAKALRHLRSGQTLVEVSLEDETGLLYGRWFNQPYLARQLTIGDEMILYGQIEPGHHPQMTHPELERIEVGEEESVHVGRIVPIYPLVAGVGQRWLRSMLAAIVESCSDDLADPLPESIRQARGWPPLPEAIRTLHFPSSQDALETAKQRLAFDELFLLQLALAHRRAQVVARVKPQRYQCEGLLTDGLRRRLPFTLTSSQQQVLQELLDELRQPYPMQRLLQGDVGSGKTIVMLWLVAVAVQSGYQAALMAPTELLAEQHVRTATGLFESLGVSVGLLTQGVPEVKRARRLEAIASGTLNVVIGTHALL